MTVADPWQQTQTELAQLASDPSLEVFRGALDQLSGWARARTYSPEFYRAPIALFAEIVRSRAQGTSVEQALRESLPRVYVQPNMQIGHDLYQAQGNIIQFFLGPSRSTVTLDDLRRRFVAASMQELRIVGSKYIPELYFPVPRTESAVEQFLASDATCFLVVAKAGRGKTNLMCHIREVYGERLPVLFLSGRVEPRDTYGLLKHVSARLGYGEDWQSCFDAMHHVVQVGTPPAIIVDGINESAAPPNMMQAALRELLVQAAMQGIKVCVTCRTDFWRFYRAPFWSEYIRSDAAEGSRPRPPRGEDLPLFPLETLPQIIARYFGHFRIVGQLVDEAREYCRNPLLLRFFCEAYRGQDVGVISEIRLYALFNLFWQSKVGQIQDLAGLDSPQLINRILLSIARSMRTRHRTRVPKDSLDTFITGQEGSQSLYGRIVDEEIILEEEVDELEGRTNIIFVYDRFSEYAIALSIFSDNDWSHKQRAAVVADVGALMEEENADQFPTLRGVLEFLTYRIEDRRADEGIQFDMINAMLERDWKWRRIGTVIAFQLAGKDNAAYWRFLGSLVRREWDFVRRMCADQLRELLNRDPERALPVLTTCLNDGSESVREAAEATLLALEAQSAIFAARALVHDALVGERSEQLAGRMLLSPLDGRAAALQEKARWLVSDQSDPTIRRAVLKYVHELGLPAYDDLFALEELASAFDIDSGESRAPASRSEYLRAIGSEIDVRVRGLHADSMCLDALRRIMSELVELLVSEYEMRANSVEALMQIPLRQAVPDDAEQQRFLQSVARRCGVQSGALKERLLDADTRLNRLRLEQNPSPSLGFIVVTTARLDESIAPLLPVCRVLSDLQDVQQPYFAFEPIRLALLADGVAREVGFTLAVDGTTIRMDTDFGDSGLRMDPDVRTELRTRIARQQNVELLPAEHRRLTSVGRLVLSIWRKIQDRGSDEKIVADRADQLADLGVADLQARLVAFESSEPSELEHGEMTLEIRALCRALGPASVGRVLEVLSTLIEWHVERDSPALRKAFEVVYWRDPANFWQVLTKLLESDDQRVIDFANQTIERAEYLEEQIGDPQIFSRFRGIVAEQLSVSPEDVTPDADFIADLNADSLDLVELIMSMEEEFDVKITDEDAEKIRTVKDAVIYLSTHRR